MDWDERFLRGDELHVPSPPLPQAVGGIPPGRALDLACGAGRHAIFLAERGWTVHAIDGSRVGVQRMLDDAYKRGVSRRILGEVADIESPRFRCEGEHDLVCDFYFLYRPLFAQIRSAVRPGGLSRPHGARRGRPFPARARRVARALYGLGDRSFARGRGRGIRPPPRHRGVDRPQASMKRFHIGHQDRRGPGVPRDKAVRVLDPYFYR